MGIPDPLSISAKPHVIPLHTCDVHMRAALWIGWERVWLFEAEATYRRSTYVHLCTGSHGMYIGRSRSWFENGLSGLNPVTFAQGLLVVMGSHSRFSAGPPGQPSRLGSVVDRANH